MTPDDALELLIAGNKRFVEGKLSLSQKIADQRNEVVVHGQHPFASILCCSDSRVPPELIFDQGLGKLFVVRVAGNISGPSEIGSLEFAVDHLETPLVVVLGHTKCGAVTAAWSDEKAPERVGYIINTIKPLVDKDKVLSSESEREEAILQTVKENVLKSIDVLINSSTPIKEQSDSGKLKVIGAVYNLASGLVELM
ncbi:MAG: carbonic anhydrase [Candidatus Electryonea clarkiae]|nr:carbonic anhydrase [Candidatus Electryonea clarkiae]MDP8286979.1 carbonic anhydrase [Candidatus Electryonea clarkiae]